MKTIKIVTNFIKNKPALIITIGILFAMVSFSMVITSGCCVGLDCGPGYYGHDNGWHGGGWYGGGGWHEGGGDQGQGNQGHGGGH